MNSTVLHILAATPTEESGSLLDLLGIDTTTLVFQMVAFLILVLVLGKWVYPVFVGIIDKREADIEASARAADEAKQAANNAEAEVAALLQDARQEAATIVSTAKTEASALVDAAESKAKKKSEALVAAARGDIDNEIKAARDQIHNEMVDLVTLATEKVVGGALSDKIDDKMVSSALKEAAK